MPNEPDAQDFFDATPPDTGPRPPVVRTPRRALRAATITAFLLLVVAPSAIWIARDRSVWPWDQAWYGEFSVKLYRALKTQRETWIEQMLNASPTKPTAVTWLGQLFVPLGRRFGHIEAGLLLSILLVQMGTLVLVYRIARHLVPDRPKVHIAACLFVASAPLFIGMSQSYLAEPFQMLAVAWIYCIAARGPLRSRLVQAAELIAAATLCILTKTTTPLYCLLPGIVGIVWVFRRRPPESGRNWATVLIGVPVLIGTGVLVIATTAWYYRNFSQVLHHVRIASSGEISLLYGQQRPFLEKTAMWANAMQQCFMLEPIVWAVAAGLVVAILVRIDCRFRHIPGGNKRLDLLAALAAMHVGVVLTVFSLAIPEETRYLLPTIVPLVVLVIWTLAQMRDKSFSAVACVLLAGQWTINHLQAHGHLAHRSDVTPWLMPAEIDAGRHDEIVHLVRSTTIEDRRDQMNVIGVDYPWLNQNSCEFFSVQATLDGSSECRFTSLGFAETDANRAWNRLLNDLNSPYFVSVEPKHRPPSDQFNVVTLSVLERVETDKRFTRVPFESRFGIIVFKQTH